MRRIAAIGVTSASKSIWPLLWFWATHLIERVHPVEAGYLRRRVRTERRSGMPIENPLVFYPKHWARTAWNQWRSGWILVTLLHLAWKIKRDPAKLEYTDAAIAPVVDDREAFDELDMIHTHGAAANKLQRAHIRVDGEAPKEHAEEPMIAAE
jgi:hypothetical protein